MGPTGGPRGVPRGYGQPTQPHDLYDPATERGGAMNQGTSSSRLVNNTLNVASSSNMPSNSGRWEPTQYCNAL